MSDALRRWRELPEEERHGVIQEIESAASPDAIDAALAVLTDTEPTLEELLVRCRERWLWVELESDTVVGEEWQVCAWNQDTRIGREARAASSTPRAAMLALLDEDDEVRDE